MMDVLKLIYGEKVTISDRQQKTFESLLMMLEIEYETTDVGPETKRPKLETKKSKVKSSSPNHPPKRRQISFNIEGQKSMSPPLHKSSFPQSIEDDPKISQQESRQHEDSIDSNWTHTSETELVSNLMKIAFDLEASTSKSKHHIYRCQHCGFKEKALVNAKVHYMQKHKNCDEELKVIKESMKFEKQLREEFEKVSSIVQSASGFDKDLLQNKIEILLKESNEKVAQLKNIKETNAPPNLSLKSKMIAKSITEINDNFVKLLSE